MDAYSYIYLDIQKNKYGFKIVINYFVFKY